MGLWFFWLSRVNYSRPFGYWRTLRSSMVSLGQRKSKTHLNFCLYSLYLSLSVSLSSSFGGAIISVSLNLNAGLIWKTYKGDLVVRLVRLPVPGWEVDTGLGIPVSTEWPYWWILSTHPNMVFHRSTFRVSLDLVTDSPKAVGWLLFLNTHLYSLCSRRHKVPIQRITVSGPKIKLIVGLLHIT